jgi:hypothetical protein
MIALRHTWLLLVVGPWAAACTYEPTPSPESTTTTGVAGSGGVGGHAGGTGGSAGSTPTGGSGGTGASGGSPMPVLVDDGLIVRYYLDEAADGQQPTELVDRAADPLPLPLSWQPEMSYVQDGEGNRGLEWTQAGANGMASAGVDGTKILTALHGSTVGTIEVVVAFTASGADGACARMSTIATPSVAGSFTLCAPSITRAEFGIDTSYRGGEWEVDFIGRGRLVLHAVLDTAQTDENLRARLFLDGAEVPRISGTAPQPSQQLNLGIGSSYVIGNRPEGGRTPNGRVYYAAMYSVALTPAQILQNTSVLISHDDAPAP